MEGQHPKRVLLIEDDPKLEAQMRKVLEEEGFVVKAAVRYDDVTRSLLDEPPHVAVVSLNLPRNSGYDVCELIRADARLTDVQILITSDRTTPAAIAYAEEAGANAFLRKPFTSLQLARYARALLAPLEPSRPSMRWLRRTEPPPP
jgi:DNA-binding response OmpR family regulator